MSFSDSRFPTPCAHFIVCFILHSLFDQKKLRKLKRKAESILRTVIIVEFHPCLVLVAMMFGKRDSLSSGFLAELDYAFEATATI